MQHQHPIKPAWASAEREVDATDAWMESTDPNNERGEVCTAFLSADRKGELSIDGISIENLEGTTYRDRAWAVKVLGADVIWRLEELECEYAAYEAADWGNRVDAAWAMWSE